MTIGINNFFVLEGAIAMDFNGYEEDTAKDVVAALYRKTLNFLLDNKEASLTESIPENLLSFEYFSVTRRCYEHPKATPGAMAAKNKITDARLLISIIIFKSIKTFLAARLKPAP